MTQESIDYYCSCFARTPASLTHSRPCCDLTSRFFSYYVAVCEPATWAFSAMFHRHCAPSGASLARVHAKIVTCRQEQPLLSNDVASIAVSAETSTARLSTATGWAYLDSSFASACHSSWQTIFSPSISLPSSILFFCRRRRRHGRERISPHYGYGSLWVYFCSVVCEGVFVS